MPAHRDPSWHIKSMPAAEREQAAKAAVRHDRSQGEWLAGAIRTQLALEAGALAPSAGQVLPPDAPGAPRVLPDDMAALARAYATLVEADGSAPRSVQRLMWARMWESLGGEPGRVPRLSLPRRP